jgi:GNAT superfamily N-acetyltransferase
MFVSEVLGCQHVTAQFHCGYPELDRWLQTSAARGIAQDTSRTYVWHSGDNIVKAYSTLAGHVLERSVLSRGQQRSLPAQIPAILLAKLALDASLQRQGLGGQLLLDALGRCVQAGQVIGVRYVVVDPIDDQAAAFYGHYGFTPIPGTTRMLRRLASIREDIFSK